MGLRKTRWNEESLSNWLLADIPEDLGDSNALRGAVARRSEILLRTRRCSFNVFKPFVWEFWDSSCATARATLERSGLEQFTAALSPDGGYESDQARSALQDRAVNAAHEASTAGATAQDSLHAARASLGLETKDFSLQGQDVRTSLLDGFDADAESRAATVLGGAVVTTHGARACTRAFHESCVDGHSAQHAAAISVFAANIAFQASGVEHVLDVGVKGAAEACQVGLRKELRRQADWFTAKL